MSYDKKYESLPDLLQDLKRMVHGANFDEEIVKRLNWNAMIDCGGNYHTIDFHTTSPGTWICPFGTESQKTVVDDFVREGFPDFASLNAELNHIRDFITNEKDLADKVSMHYTIRATSDTPHLSVKLIGTYKLDACLDSYDEATYIPHACREVQVGQDSFLNRAYNMIVPDYYSLRTMLHTTVLLPLAVVPSIYLIRRLGI
jgi:hypothetical protein